MSTNSECLFVQIKADEWFYVLEDYSAPKNAYNWMDHATAYGPFKTEDEANKHLRDNHANPGGSCTEELIEGVAERDLSGDDVLSNLIAEARNGRSSQSSRAMYGWRR